MMAKARTAAAQVSTIIRRPSANAVRAQRAADRKAYDESFSYEDDQKRAAAAEPAAPAESKAPAKRGR